MKAAAADLETAQRHRWFHAMQLADNLTTSGRFRPDQPQNHTLFSVMDLIDGVDVSGMDCLDIGATDGLISFGLEKLGAKSVVATDRVKGAGFALAHKLLNSRVERIAPSEISTILDDLAGRSFDLIVCAGVIYHMLNPLSAIMACRGLLKPGGLLIVETAVSLASDQAVMVLNSAEQSNMESSTYWLPTPKALTGMMQLCHFEALAGRWQNDTWRGAVLGRAVAGVSPGANKLTRVMQELPLLDYPFRQRLSAANDQPESAIVYSGPTGDAVIHTHAYRPNFPLHVHRIDPETAVGQSDWGVVA
jgi:2-polyprenyl-3-methyl-5-hydroxy-6-metoxy-1,4-benzoquinol methylase